MKVIIYRKIGLSIFLIATFLSISFKGLIIQTAHNTEGIAPYGVAYNEATANFVISSLAKGQLGLIDMKGKYNILCTDTRLTTNSTWGLYLQDNKVMTCVGPNIKTLQKLNKSTLAKLATIDLKTGAYLQDVNLSNFKPKRPFGSIATHVTYDSATKTAYITDMLGGSIYQITKEGKATVFSTNPLFFGTSFKGKLTEAAFGVTGIAFTSTCILVNNFSTGQILKVSSDGKIVTKVAIDLPFDFKGVTDIMLQPNGDLIVINNKLSYIYELRTTDNWDTASIIAINPTDYHNPTGITSNGKKKFILNGTNPNYFVKPYVRLISPKLQ